MDHIDTYIHLVATFLEAIGVLIISIGSTYALGKYLLLVRTTRSIGFIELRQAIGKSILLGLEVLVAADIIATIVTEPTLRSVTVLGVIVIIRTVLSISLQVELDGKFPWQRTQRTVPTADG